MHKGSFLLLFILIMTSCGAKNTSSIEEPSSLQDSITEPLTEEIFEEDTVVETLESIDLSEKYADLIDIQLLEPSIQIDIRYATSNNFMGRVLYDSIHRVFLQKEVAEKLQRAQISLKKEHPEWSLLVFDGARPLSVQQKMWDALDSIPPKLRGNFLSNPASGGSIHNYGAAVDLSIVDEHGNELDMGTPYDDIRQLAYPRMEAHFLAKGELTQEQIDNRKLLRKVMSQAGFYNISTEWWHFNSCTRAQAMQKYQVIN